MSSHNIEQSPGCMQSCLSILGDKWTALVLRDLTAEPRTFCSLETSLDGISPRTLSQRLEKLVKEGIIVKKMYCEHPPRYQYQLTKKGESLNEVLQKMADWGARYSTKSHESIA